MLHLEERVFLHGLTNNPISIWETPICLCCPPAGGFPTVTVDAKVLGGPVLATDVSGIREQLRHGQTGWIVENNEDANYEGLKFLLDHPEQVNLLCSSEGMENICSNQDKYKKLLRLVQ